MKVLQVHTRYRQRGGEDAVVHADHSLLSAAGHVVQQFLVDNPVGTVQAAVSLVGSAWNPLVASRFDRVLAAFDPDVVHVHNTWFACSPAPLRTAKKRGVPVVMTVHNFRLICANGLFLRDDQPCEKCLLGSTYNAVRHGCYRGSRMQSGIAAAGIAVHRRNNTWPELVSRFVTLSRFAAAKLAQAGIPKQQVTAGSNFVSDPGPRRFPPSASDEVLFVGRLSPEKGAADLLAAWASAEMRGLRLCVIGDGPERACLEVVAPNGVHFTGRLPVDLVRQRIARARAVVLPSVWYEGQPIVALEALSSGTPLVLSRVGGLPEVLGRCDAGWLCDPGDRSGLAAVLECLQYPDEVDRRGRAARERYEETFTTSSALSRLEDLYASVAAA